MPQICKVCRHSQRSEIDQALVAGESLRNIAGRFGTSASALHRHKCNDLPMALSRAVEAQNAVAASDLLSQVRTLASRAEAILGRAEASGDLRTALLAIREVRCTFELLGAATGQLSPKQHESVGQPLFSLPEGTRIAIQVGERSS